VRNIIFPSNYYDKFKLKIFPLFASGKSSEFRIDLVLDNFWSQDSSVYIVTRLWAGRPGLIPGRDSNGILSSSALRPDQLWSPP